MTMTFKGWLKHHQRLDEMKFSETKIEKNREGKTTTTIQSFEGTPEEIEMILSTNTEGTSNGF